MSVECLPEFTGIGFYNLRMSKMIESKARLTGGTLFVIALIVLLLGNARSEEIVAKLDNIHSDISGLRSEVESYKRQVDQLKEENLKLREQVKTGVLTIQ